MQSKHAPGSSAEDCLQHKVSAASPKLCNCENHLAHTHAPIMSSGNGAVDLGKGAIHLKSDQSRAGEMNGVSETQWTPEDPIWGDNSTLNEV